jgi:hypothetical protein
MCYNATRIDAVALCGASPMHVSASFSHECLSMVDKDIYTNICLHVLDFVWPPLGAAYCISSHTCHVGQCGLVAYRTFAHAHKRVQPPTHPHSLTYTHSHILCKQPDTYTCTHKHIVYTHTHIHTHMLTLSHTHTDTRTRTRTQTHRRMNNCRHSVVVTYVPHKLAQC